MIRLSYESEKGFQSRHSTVPRFHINSKNYFGRFYFGQQWVDIYFEEVPVNEAAASFPHASL
jgi:hypothetical protein